MKRISLKYFLSVLFTVLTAVLVIDLSTDNPKVYPISIIGDTEGIELQTRILEDGRVEIIATPSEKGFRVLEVMSERSEDIEQTYDPETGMRTILVLNNTKPVKIIFNGVSLMLVDSSSNNF